MCRRMPMYGIEGLDNMEGIDDEEISTSSDARTLATVFIRRLKKLDGKKKDARYIFLTK